MQTRVCGCDADLLQLHGALHLRGQTTAQRSAPADPFSIKVTHMIISTHARTRAPCGVVWMLGTGGSFSAVHREDREGWIRSKYEKKEYLADLPSSTLTLGEVSLDRGLV